MELACIIHLFDKSTETNISIYAWWLIVYSDTNIVLQDFQTWISDHGLVLFSLLLWFVILHHGMSVILSILGLFVFFEENPGLKAKVATMGKSSESS